VIPITEKMPAKGIRQWTIAYGLALSCFLLWFLLAFILEMLVPAIPLFYRGLILPQLITLIIILILTRTRLRPRFEHFLKCLFGENFDKDE
jgi:hypothetical protein